MAGSRNPWQRWFVAAANGVPGRWQLIRFEQLDANGNPVGKPLVALTPSNTPRLFRSEESAEWASQELNRQDGL